MPVCLLVCSSVYVLERYTFAIVMHKRQKKGINITPRNNKSVTSAMNADGSRSEGGGPGIVCMGEQSVSSGCIATLTGIASDREQSGCREICANVLLPSPVFLFLSFLFFHFFHFDICLNYFVYFPCFLSSAFLSSLPFDLHESKYFCQTKHVYF